MKGQERLAPILRAGARLLPIAWVAACADTARRTSFVVRDSAGVEIVESSAPGWERPWRLADAPAVSIGLVEGDEAYQFSDVTSGFVLPDGRIVVGHRRSPPDLRIFDATGRHERTIGGDGAGPGEFRVVFSADALGDTIRVYDPGLARITRFASTGELLRMDPVAQVDPNAATRFILFPGPRDGGFLGRSNAPRADPSSSGRAPGLSEIVLTDAVGAPRTDPLPIADGEFETGPRGPALVLFAPRAATLARDTLVYVGAGDDFAIDVYGPDLTVRRRIRRTFTPRPVTDELAAAHVAERVAAVADPLRRSQLAQSLEGRPARSHLPAHDAMFLVDDEGNLWVRGFMAPGDEDQVWSVFDARGAYLGDLTIPRNLRLLSIASDRLVAVGLDSMDVQHVQVWEIRKD